IPYVIGALWNGKDKPPDSNRDHQNNRRVFKSRSGHTVVLDDTSGAEKITITDKTGNNKIVIDSVAGSMQIACEQKLTIEAKGGVTLSAGEGDVSITCNNFSVDAKGRYALVGERGVILATGIMLLNCPAPEGVNVNGGALVVT